VNLIFWKYELFKLVNSDVILKEVKEEKKQLKKDIP
jgi:hypothetical protein